MAVVIAQISDVHIGGPNHGSGERFSWAVEAINEMTRPPDLVVVTGDLTHTGSEAEWTEFRDRISRLAPSWTAIPGNHDRGIIELRGHRRVEIGGVALVLLDTSDDEFDADDEQWLDDAIAADTSHPTVVAVHHPPFETGIWWMDCVGLRGAARLEAVVRRHGHVRHVMSGHVHRPITTTWGGCLVTVCPSTAVAVAGDLDPGHDLAEADEPPMVALHAYLDDTVVSHVVAVGPDATRTSISASAPDFVSWARQQQVSRSSAFAPSAPSRHDDVPQGRPDRSG